MSNSTYAIGVGRIWATPTSDYLGQVIPLAQRNPILIGAIQDFACSLTAGIKDLRGSESKFVLTQAQTSIDISGSFKYGNVTGESIAALMFGQTMDNGAYATVKDTVGHVISVSHSVTITAPNSGTYSKDLGVFFSASMVQLVRVASAPDTGEYSLDEATGIYTFATADETKRVLINYSYNAATGGKQLTVRDSSMGPTPFIRIDVLLTTADGEQILLTFPKCVIAKLDINAKMDDFTQNSVDFKASQDEFGRAFIFGTPR